MDGELHDNVVWLGADDDGTYRISSAADSLRVQVTSGRATYGETTVLAALSCALPDSAETTPLVYHPGGRWDSTELSDSKFKAGVSALGVVRGLAGSRAARQGGTFYIRGIPAGTRAPSNGYRGLALAVGSAAALARNVYKARQAARVRPEGYYTTGDKPRLVIRGALTLADLRPYNDIY